MVFVFVVLRLRVVVVVFFVVDGVVFFRVVEVVLFFRVVVVFLTVASPVVGFGLIILRAFCFFSLVCASFFFRRRLTV